MSMLKAVCDELMQHPEFRAGYQQQALLVRLGRSLRVARELQALTHTQMAQKLGVSELKVRRLEKGECNVTPALAPDVQSN